MSIRAEEEDKAPAGVEPDKDGGEEDGEEEQGKQPSSICAACGMQQRPEAKHCDQCGGSMAAVPDADGDAPDAPPPAAPPAAPPAKHPPPPAAPGKPAGATAFASIASVLGMKDNASTLAIKSAVLQMRSALERAMNATGTTTAEAMIGTVLSHVSDAKRVAELEGEMRQMRTQADWTKRMELGRKFASAKLPGFPPGEILVHVVDEATGARSLSLAPQYVEMKLATFESFVNAKLKSGGGTAPKATPFEPDPIAAKAAPAARSVEAARSNPVVIKAATRSFATPDQLAAAHAALFPNDATGTGV